MQRCAQVLRTKRSLVWRGIRALSFLRQWGLIEIEDANACTEVVPNMTLDYMHLSEHKCHQRNRLALTDKMVNPNHLVF